MRICATVVEVAAGKGSVLSRIFIYELCFRSEVYYSVASIVMGIKTMKSYTRLRGKCYFLRGLVV